MLDYTVLQSIWWVLLIVLLSGFVIFDGFDLGALALNPFVSKTDSERRVVINTIAPHWDGNQVWLLLGGGAIFAAYPTLYATSFSGLLLAMVLILAALFFRPIGLEYRAKFESEAHRRGVDWTLFISGFVPALVVGVGLGNVLLGFPVRFDNFGHSFYHTTDLYGESGEFFLLNLLRLLNPFALVVGLLSLCVFLTQGANWIKLRVTKDSDIYARTQKIGNCLGVAILVLMVVVTVWISFLTGYQVKDASELLLQSTAGSVVKEGTWFHNYNSYPVLYLVPALAFALYAFSYLSGKKGNDGWAFAASSLGVLVLFATFAISLFPILFPSSTHPEYSLTIFNSSSSQYTLQVMFYVAIAFTPIVLAYTAWCYYKLWGRLSAAKVEANSHSLY